MGKRCQVCDGPIVNGRCKYCGMPYRNDMELYHLNMKQAKDLRPLFIRRRRWTIRPDRDFMVLWRCS